MVVNLPPANILVPSGAMTNAITELSATGAQPEMSAPFDAENAANRDRAAVSPAPA